MTDVLEQGRTNAYARARQGQKGRPRRPAIRKPYRLAFPTPLTPSQVINSPRFTLWSTHFTRLNRLIRASHGTLVTLIGARHESFSDFPLLLTPGPAYNIMTTIDSLVLAFLRGDVREHEKVKGKEEDWGVLKMMTKDARGKEAGKQELAGEWGDVVVHEVGRT